MATYKFRNGFRNPGKLDPQKTGELLREICRDQDKELWPEKTVEAAQPEDSPIHNHFEWDDGKAAHDYRLHQARNLVNMVMIKEENPETGDIVEERAFIHVRNKKKAPYRAVEDVLTNEEWKEIARHAAVKDMIRAKKRIERWQEFSHVCELLSKAVAELDLVHTA